MKREPKIDKVALKGLINKEYGLEVKKFSFVPIGMVSLGYAVETQYGKTFCKIERVKPGICKRFPLKKGLWGDKRDPRCKTCYYKLA